MPNLALHRTPNGMPPRLSAAKAFGHFGRCHPGRHAVGRR